jgi:hypothetical protein
VARPAMLVVAGPPGSGKTMFFPASVLGQVPVELGRHPRVVARPSAELSVAVGLTLPLMTHASVAEKWNREWWTWKCATRTWSGRSPS